MDLTCLAWSRDDHCPLLDECDPTPTQNTVCPFVTSLASCVHCPGSSLSITTLAKWIVGDACDVAKLSLTTTNNNSVHNLYYFKANNQNTLYGNAGLRGKGMKGYSWRSNSSTLNRIFGLFILAHYCY